VITVGNGLFFLYLFISESSDIAAYASAPSCALPIDAMNGRGCRYDGQARVLGISRPERLQVSVAFDALPGGTFTTRFTVPNEPDITTLKVGGSASAELWNGKLTRFAGKISEDDPEQLTPTPYLITAGFSGVFAVVIFLLAIPLARAAWRSK
jgi:hypothetical protein